MSSNVQIGRLFSLIADLLELQQANPFRVRAYRRAAQTIGALPEDVSTAAAEGRLQEIPGIGKDLAEKIREYLANGTIGEYENLRDEVPDVLLQMTRIPGLGPKNALKIHTALSVQSLDDLEKAARSGAVAALEGFGAKSAENILEGIAFVRRSSERHPLGLVLPMAEAIRLELDGLESVERISIAGSLRRMKETIGDVDVLVTGTGGAKIIRIFSEYPRAERVLAAGDTKGSIMVKGGIQVDLRIVEPRSYGAAMQYFTGSKAHNVRCRNIARSKGMKLSEYGLFKGEKMVAGKSEEQVYEVSIGVAE